MPISLGLPLNEAAPEAAPHGDLGRQPRDHAGCNGRGASTYPAEEWNRVDVTDIYQAARREVFETCERVTVHAQPGEAYLVHRLSLHGVAPWAGPEVGDRRIAYFRPAVETVQAWLELP